MLRLLIDTCVWLDMAKDYRHRPALHALGQMIDAEKVALALPQQTINESARNKERIIKESGALDFQISATGYVLREPSTASL